MIEELAKLYAWLSEGRGCCLAIVTKTWGSAPRAIGSLMVIRNDGTFEGSVSGGCVEGTVISAALSLTETKEVSRQLSFTVANDDAWQVGLACGGEIEIRLLNMAPESLDQIYRALDMLKHRQSGQLCFDLKTGAIDAIETKHPFATRPKVIDDILYLSLVIVPRIFIIGAVHIAQKLCEIAACVGYQCFVIDPRLTFLENRHFSEAECFAEWPDDFLAHHVIDSTTAIVTLTHDPKIDDVCLKQALTSDAFYIGALGSKKTHATRLDRLREEGFRDVETKKISGPIGLDIDAETPAEIAVSIMAEITLLYRQALSVTDTSRGVK